MKMHGLIKKFAAIALVAGGVSGVSTTVQAEEPQASGWNRGLEGTWVVEVTLQNCATHEQVAPPFTSLLTFARGGTMTETTSAPAFYPAVRGPGHGVWEGRKGAYTASTLALITMNGALVKTQTITQKITLSASEKDFTSSAAIQFATPTGVPIMQGCASAVGTRYE